MKFPYTTSYAEVFAIVSDHHYSYSGHQVGIGQLIANKYELPKELEDKIYQICSVVELSVTLCEWFHREGYQQ